MPINPLNPNPNVVTDVNHIDGIYRGIVEDNDDPLNLCRLRVRVPYLNGMPDSPDGIPTDGLPWAAACVPYGGPGYGQVLIPDVGSTVWVMFENQAKDRPVWIGCSYGAPSVTGKRDMKSVGYDTFVNSEGKWTYDANREDTPYTFGYHRKNSKVVIHTPKGFEISIDEADEHECLELIDRSGQIIRMYCPISKEGNTNNGARRTTGSVMNNDVSEGVLQYSLDNDARNRNYILIESQSSDNKVQSSYIRLSKKDLTYTNGENVCQLYDKKMVFDVGDSVRSVYDGDNCTYVVTNQPNSTFQMSPENNSITRGSSEVVVDDNEVRLDNGSVAIRLGSCIDLYGPVRWGYSYDGRNYGQFNNHDDNWFKQYYPHMKLATGEGASIVLDGDEVIISGKIRLASGSSSITVDDDIKLSGDTDVTNNEASISLRGNKVTIDSPSTKIASSKSSIIVNDSDKLGNIDGSDGDIIISGDTKIATGESSLIIAEDEVDISTKEAKIANGTSSFIFHDNFIETNNCSDMVDPPDGRHPQRIGEVTMDDVSKEDVTIEVKSMDDVSTGDVSINDSDYENWYTGQHIDMLPIQ